MCEAPLEPELKLPFIGHSGPRPNNRGMTRLTPPFRAALPALLALALASPLALADSDQDRARAAVQAGKVLPLKAVLERLEREHPGQVLAVELEQDDDGRWIYEIKLLQPGGRLVRLELDAASAELLRRKERARRHEGRR